MHKALVTIRDVVKLYSSIVEQSYVIDYYTDTCTKQ